MLIQLDWIYFADAKAWAWPIGVLKRAIMKLVFADNFSYAHFLFKMYWGGETYREEILVKTSLLDMEYYAVVPVPK
jgi:hypothetical protein